MMVNALRAKVSFVRMRCQSWRRCCMTRLGKVLWKGGQCTKWVLVGSDVAPSYFQHTMALLLCTGNEGKVKELLALLPPGAEVVGLEQVGLPTDLPENGDTLEANALEKARFAFDRTGMPCLADDTGLEVPALNGAPGVLSARYAGGAKDAAANMALLLRNMAGNSDRRARFRTVMAYVDSAGERLFEGVVNGRLLEEPRGSDGFGYDPLFVPVGEVRSFAEMSLGEKNTMSHRARAMEQVVIFLRSAQDRP